MQVDTLAAAVALPADVDARELRARAPEDVRARREVRVQQVRLLLLHRISADATSDRAGIATDVTAMFVASGDAAARDPTPHGRRDFVKATDGHQNTFSVSATCLSHGLSLFVPVPYPIEQVQTCLRAS